VARIDAGMATLVGDTALAAAFACYAGPLSAAARGALAADAWAPDVRSRGLPLADAPSPVDMLVDDATRAGWSARGLGGDATSAENGAILATRARWPLLVDPQLQGVRWLAATEPELVTLTPATPGFEAALAAALDARSPVLVEGLGDDLPHALDPLLRVPTGTDAQIRLGDAEVELRADARLFLATRLPAPAYGPEVAAAVSVVDFAVTRDGLHEQLLAAVVDAERPELQAQAASLAAALGGFAARLTSLEDGLLARLASSTGDILDDEPLVVSLETTKATASEVEAQAAAARAAAAATAAARAAYAPAAARGAALYLLTASLPCLDRVYHFSMAAFVHAMAAGMAAAPSAPTAADGGSRASVGRRVDALVDSITRAVHRHIAQGLFGRHRLPFAASIAVVAAAERGGAPPAKLAFLVAPPRAAEPPPHPGHPWLTDTAWCAVAATRDLPGLEALADDVAASPKRWADFAERERPEADPLPGDWKRVDELDRLLVFRALRPDRLAAAAQRYVGAALGAEYASPPPADLPSALADASAASPVLIFLSDGVDAASAVETAARNAGRPLTAVSLGQGQEPVADAALAAASSSGDWVLLQNVHLTTDWTAGALAAAVDAFARSPPHPSFRLVLTAEPPPALEAPLPTPLLQACVKVTAESPDGLRAGVLRAYASLSDDAFDACSKPAELRTIAAALAVFHGLLLQRKKFGVGNALGSVSGAGWCMGYPFAAGDLLCAVRTAAARLDASPGRLPWGDLRYMVGEIVYGGHVVEAPDRAVVAAYLARLLSDAVLDGGDMIPGLPPPPSGLPHAAAAAWLEDAFPAEVAAAYGMHANAEIGCRRRESVELCVAVGGLLVGGGLVVVGGGTATASAASTTTAPSADDAAKAALAAVLDKLPPEVDAVGARARAGADVGPLLAVALQEGDALNATLATIRASLDDLSRGLSGELARSDAMEALAKALAEGRAPAGWVAAGGRPSLLPLDPWLGWLRAAATQIVDWLAEGAQPRIMHLPSLFAPRAFLTALAQAAARRAGWPLDATTLIIEPAKKGAIDGEPPRDGALLGGLLLEGARWDERAGALDDPRPRELVSALPPLLARAVPADKADAAVAGCYACPLYGTAARFRQEVGVIHLRSRAPPDSWTLAGVAALCEGVGGV
jgi:dynein heavy chain